MAKHSDVAIGTWPTPERTVRVVVPAKVAFDLTSMQRVTANVLQRLGCDECHSGWDIRYELENRFLVDEKLRVREAVSGTIETD